MIVVIPVCRKDHALVLKNLAWLDRLGAPYKRPALVAHDSSFDPGEVVEAVKKRFSPVHVFRYSEWRGPPEWPYPQNWAWQMTAKYVERAKLGPWLWWEADATPLRENWVTILADEYAQGGKAFMGYVVDEHDGHMNGVGVYPQEISKYVRDALIARQVPFDVVARNDVSRNVHRANHLIQWTPEAVTFPGPAVQANVCLFHKCKDGSLIDMMVKNSGLVQRIADAAKTFVSSTYYHSGNLGDIIYGLYAIRKRGRGKATLLIGPEQVDTAPCAVPVSRSQYENLAPLLAKQSYLKASDFSPQHPRSKSVIDLNTFRNAWRDWPLRSKLDIHTLCGMHCHILGVTLRHTEPWLTAPDPIQTGMIVCHRSVRYRNNAFPWQMLVKYYSGRLLFVGLPQEHSDFCHTYGRVAYWQPFNFLELARVIAGARGFIGNQSFPCSLAIGLGQRILQESWPDSPDCIFRRGNFLTQPFDESHLPQWEKSTIHVA